MAYQVPLHTCHLLAHFVHLDHEVLHIVGSAGRVTLGTACAITMVADLLSQVVDLSLKLEDGVCSGIHLDEAALRGRVLITTKLRVDSVQCLDLRAKTINGAVDSLHPGLMSEQIFSDSLEVGFVLVLSNLELADARCQLRNCKALARVSQVV